MPCQKALENIGKENKSMAVKIKKQPVTITLEELKQGEEYERVTIHIDEDKKHEIENKYGIYYGFLPVMNFNDAEFDFKEHYLMVDSNSNKKIPYEIIEKIEVVGKWMNLNWHMLICSKSQYRSIKDSKGGYGIYLHLQCKDGKYKDELMMMVHPQLLVGLWHRWICQRTGRRTERRTIRLLET